MVGTRQFGQTALAPTAVVWSAWAMGAAALTLPVEQWLARIGQLPALAGTSASLRRLLWLASVALFLVLGAGAWMVRGRLFNDSGWHYPLIFGLTWLGAIVMGVTRGSLSASRRFRAGAFLLAIENLARLAIGGAVVIAGADVVLFTAAIPIGSLSALIWLRREARRPERSLNRRDTVPLFALTSASLTAQLVLTGGPLVAALLQANPAAVTGLFTAMALCRVPYQLLPGFSGKLSVGFTHMWLDDAMTATKRLLGALLTAGVGVPLVGGLIAWSIGTPLIRVMFGGVQVPVATTTIVAVATGLAMVAFVASLCLTAVGRTGRLLGAWVAGLIASLLTTLYGSGDVTQRMAWAFLAGELTALVGCLAMIRFRPHRLSLADLSLHDSVQ